MRFILKTHKAKAEAAEYILNLPKKPVMECKLVEYKRQRSAEANRRHWAVLDQIRYWMGKRGEVHTKETWHLYFLQEFIEPISNIVNHRLTERYSSREMTTFEFNELDNEIEAWAGDNEIQILDADEWREFKKAS